MQAVLVPGLSVGNPSTALGAFQPGPTVTTGQIFGWEVILTLILVRLSQKEIVAVLCLPTCRRGQLAAAAPLVWS